MSDLTQSSACELCKIALATGALFLDHREPLRPIPDCIPYCRSTVFGPKLHLVTPITYKQTGALIPVIAALYPPPGALSIA